MTSGPAPRLRARLDPRRHLAAAIGWAMLAVAALAALAAGQLAARDAEQAARVDAQRLMTQFATQVELGLAMSLQTRLSVLKATAIQIEGAAPVDPLALRPRLAAVQMQFPEFASVAVTDAQGRVLAGALPMPPPASRHAPPAASARLSDAPAPPGTGAARIVQAEAPILWSDGSVRGAVVARLSWDWIVRLLQDQAATLDHGHEFQVLLLGADGHLLAGPSPRGPADDPAEGGRYVVGRARVAGPTDDALRWQVAVRQRADAALAGVSSLHRTVLWSALLAGLLVALAGLVLTHWLTRRLAALAAQAQAVRQGRQGAITPPGGEDEVARIGAALSELVGHLQREKAALAQLNAELDARVADRTARIERMAEQARQAAVTRERLRLARDLHDTLAHSLMALLQQIRLVRKLRARWSAEQLADELGRAEQVAADGLAGARAAITQMRHGSVGEIGLAAALRELVARFGERTGLRTRLATGDAAADLADARAEALYRIVEEALRNVERHARAQAVWVSIADGATGSVLVVRDDGIGFDPHAPCTGHYGLQGMREQAALIDARLEVDSQPGRGTSIRLAFEP